MTVEVPDKADDWPFEAKAAAICEVNSATEIREEIDGAAGIGNPNWKETESAAGHFSKHELTLLLLALGGPQ